MKLLILSDIHANLPALDAVLLRENFDLLLCAGDIVGYGPFPNEVIEALSSINAVCVMGDHEYAVLTGDTRMFNPYAAWSTEWTRKAIKEENKKWLKGLSTVQRFAVEGVTISVFHGSPFDPLWEYVFPEASPKYLRSIIRKAGTDIVILGHTHIPFLFRWKNRLLINPGSVGQPRDGDPRASYVILELPSMKVKNKRVEYEVDVVKEKMAREGFPEFLWKRLYEGL